MDWTASRAGTRALTIEDLPELLRLSEAYDTHWFGEPESSADEVAEEFHRMLSPASDSIALAHEGRLFGAALRIGTDAVLAVDPAAVDEVGYDALLSWVEACEPRLAVNALSRDTGLAETLRRRGWTYHHSAFELSRDVSPGAVVSPPELPAGMRLTPMQEPERVHDLIYRRAGWASMVGHGDRDLGEWQRLFLPAAVKPGEQLLAWDGPDLVGVALGRIFADGTGWISQLAVAAGYRGRGLGRTLLLTMHDRHIAAGASKLGLQVSARNEAALALYLDVGLHLDREWREFRRG